MGKKGRCLPFCLWPARRGTRLNVPRAVPSARAPKSCSESVTCSGRSRFERSSENLGTGAALVRPAGFAVSLLRQAHFGAERRGGAVPCQCRSPALTGPRATTKCRGIGSPWAIEGRAESFFLRTSSLSRRHSRRRLQNAREIVGNRSRGARLRQKTYTWLHQHSMSKPRNTALARSFARPRNGSQTLPDEICRKLAAQACSVSESAIRRQIAAHLPSGKLGLTRTVVTKDWTIGGGRCCSTGDDVS